MYPGYGNRAGWRPKIAADFQDGGAFPEILLAQYPLDMGRKHTEASNSLAVQVDGAGKLDHTLLARAGHNNQRIIHASFKDLIPLRQQASIGDISLEKPSDEEVNIQTLKTKEALAKLVQGAVAAQKPKNIRGTQRHEPVYVRYTPAHQMGKTVSSHERIIKIVERQQDPMGPPKFKHKKVPRGPPSPPPPMMHSPTRKLTAEDQELWKIPPPVSNWKNPKGYTVPLDKRLAADGRGLQDVTINDKFAQFAEALFTADRHAREEVKQRASMQQKLAEKEKGRKEEQLLQLAKKAREARVPKIHQSPHSRKSSDSLSQRSWSDDEAKKEREDARRERRRDDLKEFRQSRMGAQRRVQVQAREENRDISERVALGLAKPTQTSEAMYDSRLFNQTSGFDTGFNEDQAYDRPLFAARDAISSIYRTRATIEDEDEDVDGNQEYDKIKKTARFEALGRPKEGFQGTADATRYEGPVQFEKEEPKSSIDPFKIDEMIQEVTQNSGISSMQEINTDRPNKRPRSEMT